MRMIQYIVNEVFGDGGFTQLFWFADLFQYMNIHKPERQPVHKGDTW